MKHFSDAYREMRNRLRKFSRSSILKGAIQTLRTPYNDKFEEMRSMPAQILLLVKWTLQDRMMDHDQGPAITSQQFGELRQRLWEIQDEVHTHISAERPMHLFLRQVLRPQLGFQVPISPGFVREAAMLATLPADHGLTRIWKEKTGLNLDDFVALQYVVFGLISSGDLSFNESALLAVVSRAVLVLCPPREKYKPQLGGPHRGCFDAERR